MLPEEMLIHVNTSPLKAYWGLLLGQLGALLPAKEEAAAGLAAPQRKGCPHLSPVSHSSSSDRPSSPPSELCCGIRFTVSTAEGKILSPE